MKVIPIPGKLYEVTEDGQEREGCLRACLVTLMRSSVPLRTIEVGEIFMLVEIQGYKKNSYIFDTAILLQDGMLYALAVGWEGKVRRCLK